MATQLQSYDPSDQTLLGSVTLPSQEQITTQVASAHKAQSLWKQLSLEKRLEAIQKAYAAAEPEMERLAELLSREMGKDIRRATGEVHSTIYGGPYIAQEALQALQPVQRGRSTSQYTPFGVVAVISPWNYPLAMANNLIIPALMAGNTVLWKPSEETPLIAQEFFERIAPHFPMDVLQIIHGNGEQGRMLVESAVQLIAFTGSQQTGKDIMQRAAKDLKRLVMELGGNDPMIVMPDADLQAAARFAVGSSFENTGQMCISTERIYVEETVADTFEQLVVTHAANCRVGAWNLTGVNIGPVANRKQHAKVQAHIQDAVMKGATLLLGSEVQEPPFIHPTVIAGMQPDMLIEKEETFGPVICMSRYSDLDQAIERANDSSYGLGAVVFGNQGADQVAERLEAGMVGINQSVGGEGDSPWVGAKQSGFGFHGSVDGHRQFAQVKVVSR
ncbi:aldehyde dehydrogenase [Desulfobulbus rhabdoformis]|uniref:aldehyde dehydrogenase family protein n=1 Tax=Desulfobulbus rhabdoformis TaxID=34032 RepID=UPI0019669FE2|nr:aldehyde dehydrogenase family protein [Desulfobulbus rhabdoformis]MBM9615083.1 aldehyde dehydrogenase [Desulfobulbus rhabdoformis]